MAQWNVIGHGLFASELTGNLFYLLEVIFEIPKWYFIIQPPAFWGADVSIEIYQLLLLFSIISSCSKKALFPEDSLLPKFFYGEFMKEEELGGGSFGSTDKLRLKRDTVAIKKFIWKQWEETAKNFLKNAKILEGLNHLNVASFKNVDY